MLTLRPYQRQTIDAVRAAWRDGCADVLAVLATGAGKTIIFLALIDEILKEQPHARFLLIAHRKELIEQPAERIAQFWPQRAAAVGRSAAALAAAGWMVVHEAAARAVAARVRSTR